jgi:hypothetical protein
MEETVVGSNSSASNVHEAANDNTNPYRNMVMDAVITQFWVIPQNSFFFLKK